MSEKIKCYLCLEYKKREDFNIEHVIQAALYEPKNLENGRRFVLKNKTCKCCNSYFGKTIDYSIHSRGFEAVAAAAFNHISKKKGKMFTDEVIVSIDQPGLSFDGHLVAITKKTGHLHPVPQIKTENKNGDKNFYAIDSGNFENDFALICEQIKNQQLSGLEFLYNTNRGSTEKILQKINNKCGTNLFIGEDFKIEPFEIKGIGVKAETRFNDDFVRGICKIAFNFAVWAFDNNSSVLYDSSFHPIRNFIRYGEGKNIFLFKGHDQITKNYHNRKYLILNIAWYPVKAGYVLQCVMKLFSGTVYVVNLCDSFVPSVSPMPFSSGKQSYMFLYSLDEKKLIYSPSYKIDPEWKMPLL